MSGEELIGPFSEIVTLENLPLSGPIQDKELIIHKEAGILVKNGLIQKIAPFLELKKNYKVTREITKPSIALPGFIDAHTHLCFAGTRSSDYAKKLSSISYLEIAKQGGGILDTVRKTRAASKNELGFLLRQRLDKQLSFGVTTVEIKSGYGLSQMEELKILEVIQEVAAEHKISVIATCLAAHTLPKEFATTKEYLSYLKSELLPKVKTKNLASRVDIFVEEGAFGVDESIDYLNFAKSLGFDLTVHADQFHPGGSFVAKETKALSADHLECSSEKELLELKAARVSPIVLPGASLGLGLAFAKARQMLDLGMPLVIASDWNPGSAPMGQLLTQAAILGVYEKLTMAETFSALTFRAAKALSLHDRGRLLNGLRADFSVFETDDFKDILYYQGALLPKSVFIEGKLVKI